MAAAPTLKPTAPVMLKQLLKALFVSMVATGTAILVFRRMDQIESAPVPRRGPPEVDADALDPAERDALLRELDEQL